MKGDLFCSLLFLALVIECLGDEHLPRGPLFSGQPVGAPASNAAARYSVLEPSVPGQDLEDELCVDKKTRCEYWTMLGECSNNKGWTASMCRKTCAQCGKNKGKQLKPGCEDISPTCAEAAKDGRCEAFAWSMLWRCPISCGACGPRMKCRNWHTLCSIYANKGECQSNSVWMNRFCPRACKLCTGGTDSDCKNYHDSVECDRWANTGECVRSPDYMLSQCTKACGACGDVCLDRLVNCTQMATKEKCASEPELLNIQCPVSCGICKDNSGNTAECKDYDFNCEIWKDWGECEYNPGFMNSYCSRSCGRCDTV